METLPMPMAELREIAARSAGLAGAALSRLARSAISVQVHQAQMLPLPEVSACFGEPDRPAVGLLCRAEGELNGCCAFLLHDADVRQLLPLLLSQVGGDRPDCAASEEMRRSALEETGNIIIAAFLNGFAEHFGVLTIPGVPQLTTDLSGAIVDAVVFSVAQEADHVLVFHTALLRDQQHFEAVLLFVPDAGSMKKMNGWLHVR